MPADPTAVAVGILTSGRNAGHFTLPPELDAALAQSGRVTTLAREAGARARAASPEQMRAKVRRELVTSALEGATVDEKALTQAILAAAADAERLSILTEAYAEAVDQARQAVGEVYRDVSEAIVAEHLRPALAETIDAVRTVAPPLKDLALPLDADALLTLREPQRKAYVALLAHAERYRVVRRAYSLVAATLGLGHATGDPVSEVANWRDLFVVDGMDFYLGHKQSGFLPWPKGELDRLIWLASEGVEPWLPLPADYQAALDAIREQFAPVGRLPDRHSAGWIYAPRG